MFYSLDLRKRVMSAVHSGMQKKRVCEIYNICKQTIYNWLKVEKERGHLEPNNSFQKGHSHGITDLNKFREFIDSHPDYTQEEIAKYFSVGSSTVGRALKKIGYSRKKRVKLMQKGKKKNVMNTLKK